MPERALDLDEEDLHSGLPVLPRGGALRGRDGCHLPVPVRHDDDDDDGGGECNHRLPSHYDRTIVPERTVRSTEWIGAPTNVRKSPLPQHLH